jgi:MFS superfamily sulfate permease-like transporter
VFPKPASGATCPLILGFAVAEAHGCSDVFGLWPREELVVALTAILFLLVDFVDYAGVCWAMVFIVRSREASN